MPRGPSAVAIIPARIGSTRFPGKVLRADTGKPLLLHVCERAAAASSVSRVIVATDAPEVRDALVGAGVEVVMTRVDHPNGTARLAEAADILGLDDETMVINVQGDEPEIDPGLIDATLELTARSGEPMGTLAGPFQPGEDPHDPNIVKVVARAGADGIGRAIYFSRAPIPFDRDGGGVRPHKHAGLYVYRRAALARFVGLPESPLERTEKLEQLRAVEAGWGIALAIRPFAHVGIDTPEQYRAFVGRHRAAGDVPGSGLHPGAHA